MKQLHLLLTIVSLFTTSTKLTGQNFSVGIGRRFESAVSTTIFLDSIVAQELNTNKRTLSVFAFYQDSLTNRLSWAAGIHYHTPFVDIFASKVIPDDPLYPVWKAGGVRLNVLEVPLEVRYTVLHYKQFSLSGLAGIAPVITLSKKGPAHQGDPNDRDFPPSVAQVLNATPSAVKNLYADYHLGAQVTYWRLSFRTQYQRNLSSDIGEPLEVWGRQFNFRRRNASITFGLLYNF